MSGEALGGPARSGIDGAAVSALAESLGGARASGVQIGVVVGGGNMLRGRSDRWEGMERTTVDQMGMLATCINVLALREALHAIDIPATVFSAIDVRSVLDPYSTAAANAALERGDVVLFAGGTGNPFFSTDSAAALRSCELKADALLKGTRVDGVYDEDPERSSTATRFESIRYQDVIEKDLKVMDLTAFALCRENGIPVIVFKLEGDNLARVLRGEEVGTTVKETI